MTKNKFEAVIGIEVHAQIATESKMFCGCSSDSFDKEPNINTCPICMGFPGQLPVVNDEAVKKGVKASLALNCEVPEFCKFDRKNYFYPDLPKGFQISQFDEPLALNGWIEINVGGESKKINITRLHLEDDAGKLTHVANGTLCDYNRSGIALMEIVSEPEIRTPAEAAAYAKAMQTVLRYCMASDADMEKGKMRFDASVSIRPVGEQKLYPRAEIKNLNSFKALESAVKYEIERQEELWNEGKASKVDITVGWMDAKQKTYFLRDKEGADDYRYFPEPDLPPLRISEEFVDEMKREVPELPGEKRRKYVEDMALQDADAILISSDLRLATYFEEVVSKTNDPKRATTFITTVLMGLLKRDGKDIGDVKISANDLAELINLVKDGKISMNIAKGDVFEEMYKEGRSPAKIVKERGLGQVSDSVELEKICKEVLSENEKSIEDYKNGKDHAFYYLVGQVMKKTKGQANPQMVNELLKKHIS